MAYPEISPRLDFTIVDTHNPLTLGIADTSFYPDNFTVTNPTYEIIPPAFPKVALAFIKEEVLFVNSNNLNITCVNDPALLAPLPDGIWKIRQSIAPVIDFNLEKSFLRTLQLEQKFGRAFMRTDLIECNQDMRREQMKVLDQAYLYMQAAISAANQCNYILSMKLYRYADKMLENFIKGICGNEKYSNPF